MVTSEHLKPVDMNKRILEFNWRMRCCAEFNQRIQKYIKLLKNIEQIARLGLRSDPKDTYKVLKNHEDELQEILELLEKQQLSAFHQDIGVN